MFSRRSWHPMKPRIEWGSFEMICWIVELQGQFFFFFFKLLFQEKALKICFYRFFREQPVFNRLSEAYSIGDYVIFKLKGSYFFIILKS